MEFIIFKSPYIMYRKENFGGIVKSNSQFYIINKKQFKFLSSFPKFKYLTSLKKTEQKIAQIFLDKGIFLKVNTNSQKIKNYLQKNNYDKI